MREEQFNPIDNINLEIVSLIDYMPKALDINWL